VLLSTPGRAAVLAAAVANNGGRLRRGAAQAPQHKIDLNIKLKQMVKEQEKVRLVVLQPTLRMAEDVPIDVNGQTLLGVHVCGNRCMCAPFVPCQRSPSACTGRAAHEDRGGEQLGDVCGRRDTRAARGPHQVMRPAHRPGCRCVRPKTGGQV
jgi:hypothetical protein